MRDSVAVAVGREAEAGVPLAFPVVEQLQQAAVGQGGFCPPHVAHHRGHRHIVAVCRRPRRPGATVVPASRMPSRPRNEPTRRSAPEKAAAGLIGRSHAVAADGHPLRAGKHAAEWGRSEA